MYGGISTIGTAAFLWVLGDLGCAFANDPHSTPTIGSSDSSSFLLKFFDPIRMDKANSAGAKDIVENRPEPLTIRPLNRRWSDLESGLRFISLIQTVSIPNKLLSWSIDAANLQGCIDMNPSRLIG